MRILHVITGLHVGGAETMLYRLVRASRDHVHRVVSLMDEGLFGRPLETLGVEVRPLHMARGRFPRPDQFLRLVREMRAFAPDVVQTWMYHADLLGGLAAATAGRAPVVWGLHNSTLDRVTTRRTTHWTVAACARLSRSVPARIVSVSRASRDIHVNAGYDPDRFVVIPNGFDPAEYVHEPGLRSRTRAELGLDDASVVIAMVARVDPQKDHATFLRAAGILARARPDVRFLLCGAGATGENPELTRAIDRESLADRVLLLGVRNDVPRLLSAVDVATLSSAYGDAFPLCVGEAMASGVPCVVTDVGDCRHLVGDTGLTVPPRDPEALAAAWGELVASAPGRRHRLGAAARRRIEEHFSLERTVAAYEAVYREVAEVARSARPRRSRARWPGERAAAPVTTGRPHVRSRRLARSHAHRPRRG